MEDLLWLVSFADDDDRELSTHDIANALSAGQIHFGTLVWRDGMSEWSILTDVPELSAVVARQRAMAVALKKRQTVLGGFRATPAADAQPATTSLPPLPSPPQRPPELVALANATSTPVMSAPHAEASRQRFADTMPPPREAHSALERDEPPTMRQSIPAPNPETHARGGLDRNTALGGFQLVPPRRRLSSGVSLEGELLEEDELTELRRSAPLHDIPKATSSNPYASEITVDRISGFEARPTPFDDDEPLSSSDFISAGSRLGARELNWNPKPDPSAPSHERIDESFLEDAFPSGPPPSVEVLPQSGRVHAGRRPAGPQRTIPPRSGNSPHVVTFGAPVEFGSGMPQGNVLQPARTAHPVKRFFLYSMAAIAMGAVVFLALRPREEEPEVAQESANPPSKVFAAQPGPANAAAASAENETTSADVKLQTVNGGVTGKGVLPVKAVRANNSVLPGNGAGPDLKQLQKPRATPASSPAAMTTAAVAKAKAGSAASDSQTEAAALASNGQAPAATPEKSSARSALAGSAPNADRTTSASPAGAAEPAINEFDRGAAVQALEAAASNASSCRQSGDPTGVARVSVTFSDSGQATRAIVDGPPFAGTATGGCIAEMMRKARIPSFTGERVTVKKTVVIQ